MPTESALDFPTVSALVRLRILTEEARRRSMDTSDAGRHVALIALDGACEYALWLAANACGAELKNTRTSLHELYKALKLLLGDRWNVRGWPGVQQLHRARNDAQHAAIAIDPGELPRWSDAAWAFIDSLCNASFGLELGGILLADAIRDHELRTHVRWSEEALFVERGRAFDLALRAFDRALERWRAQHELLEFAPPPAGLPLMKPDLSRGVQGNLRQLDVLLEVQPFANDIGEYFWLCRARQEFESARWPPSEGDERRALLFVANWIVRWEIFDQGYPDDRWEAHRESIGPPVVGDGLKLEIHGSQTDLLPEISGHGGRRVALYLQLANVPGRGRAPWEELLRQALSDCARESGAAGLFAHVGWHLDGFLELHVALKSVPGSVGAIVRRAVNLAVERFDQSLIDAGRRVWDREQMESRFRELIVSARSDLAFFDDVRVVRDIWMNTNDWMVLIHLKGGVAGYEEVSHAVSIFRDVARTLRHIHMHEGCVAFQACALTEEVEREFRDAVERTEGQVRHLRSIRAGQGQAYEDFARSIREQFGELPIG